MYCTLFQIKSDGHFIHPIKMSKQFQNGVFYSRWKRFSCKGTDMSS